MKKLIPFALSLLVLASLPACNRDKPKPQREPVVTDESGNPRVVQKEIGWEEPQEETYA
ncbi:MAG: hypothetical protein WDZ41_05635 [Candidatus Babeliales bacterium]